jgi:sn-glycerol 3-phosphate transport system substrate-binding protein
MLVQSTSSLGGILNKADFEVGTAFLPRLQGDYPEGNSVIGGGCLWVLEGHSPAEYDAAWQFLQYSFSPERAKIWHKGTGYFPISNTAYKQLQDEGWFEEEPNHATAFNQILSGADTPAARGVLLGNFVQIRDIVGTAIEEALVNGMDPQTALDQAAEESNRVLAEYAELHGEQ